MCWRISRLNVRICPSKASREPATLTRWQNIKIIKTIHPHITYLSLSECLCLPECLSIAGHFSSCTLHLQETSERRDSESGVQHRTCESGSAALSSSSGRTSSPLKVCLVLVCRSISWWSVDTVWERARRLCWPFSCAAHIPHSSATPSLHQGAWWGNTHTDDLHLTTAAQALLMLTRSWYKHCCWCLKTLGSQGALDNTNWIMCEGPLPNILSSLCFYYNIIIH